MNDFNECLNISNSSKTLEFWDKVYTIAFPNMTNHMVGKNSKCKSQDYGVDRIIYLENGKTITIDEKVRTGDYTDIALEYISNDKIKSVGWIEKDLAIDYLAYAFLPSQKVYLFDWRILKNVWNKNKEEWINVYFNARAINKDYVTISVCVPINVLMTECSNATIITLPP